jgi:hypothetical protein
MIHRLRQFALVFVGLTAFGAYSNAALAGRSPCAMIRRVHFADDVGNPSLNDVFAEAQRIAASNLEIKINLKAGKCALIKLAKTKKWKETLKVLRASQTKRPDVLAAAKKLKGDLPAMSAVTKLIAEAKALDLKMKSLVAIKPEENFQEAYDKNVKALDRTVKQVLGLQVQIPTVRKKMDKIIAAHSP